MSFSSPITSERSLASMYPSIRESGPKNARWLHDGMSVSMKT